MRRPRLMTRLTLRKGFTLQPAPGGVGHLTDTRTGDALVVSPGDFQALLAAGKEFDPTEPQVAAVLPKYRPFYTEALEEAPPGSFYELDIEDAPTVPQIPSIAPVTLERPAVAPAPEPELKELEPLPEPETTEHAAFDPSAAEEFTQPAGLQVPQPAEPVTHDEPLLPLEPLTREEPLQSLEPVTREETLQQAQEPQRTEQVSPAEVQAAIVHAASMGEPSAAPEFAAVPRSTRRPLVRALGGVTLLALAVAATFALRPKGETPLPEVPAVTTVVDAGAPEAIVDAGTPEAVALVPESVIDAGVTAPLVPEPVIDAGALAAETELDAGGAEAPETQWLTAAVQARGRVKMGEVVAGAEGELSWTITEEERVKGKQVIGALARASGEPLPVTASSVGLVKMKQLAGAKVRRGAVLAEIIYFEAWARAQVKGPTPKMGWRCEVSSEALHQRSECKISVVAPKAGGAAVTVAIEPRWFDGATDAVLHFAP